MEYRATIGFRAVCRLNLTIANMAQDLHTLRFMLEEVQSLIKNNKLESARAKIERLFQFYEEAELDGVPFGFISAIMNKAEEIRSDLNLRLPKNEEIRSDPNIRLSKNEEIRSDPNMSKNFLQKWCSEIPINSVQCSDSSRYGILAQVGTVIHNFGWVLEWVCLCLPCRGYWARFLRMDSPFSSIT